MYPAAGGRIEHPLRHLQRPGSLHRFEPAAKNKIPVLGHRIENPNRATMPRMPGIKNYA